MKKAFSVASDQNTVSKPDLASLAPGLFVLLWSTGFIGSKYGSYHAEPFTMTALRMSLVLAVLGIIVAVSRAPWPKTMREFQHLAVVGALVHATYLCGVLYALRSGLPAGLVAMIAGVQPILTALLGRTLLGERLSKLQWLGMLIGLAGVSVVVLSKYHSALFALFVGAEAASTAKLGFALCYATIALCGISVGTLYQKRFCTHIDLRSGAFVQYLSTLAICAVAAFSFETREIDWQPEFIGALIWLALVLSIGAIGLLYFMIARGAASQVASLFFLTPTVTAVLAWLLFQESLSWFGIAGMALTALGVLLVAKFKLPST